MATDELAVQTKIVKSVRHDGGYARKCSNRFAIGVPDLLVALPPFAPCYIEVKDFGKVNDKFDRQVDTTEKQVYELELFSKPYEDAGLGRVGFVAVSLIHRGEHRLVLGPREMARLSSDYENSPLMWTKRQTGGYYNLAPMLRFWSAAKARERYHLRGTTSRASALDTAGATGGAASATGDAASATTPANTNCSNRGTA